MRFSVIIPTHDRCSLLSEAISSVLRQNAPACEIIVCDDGSTEDMSAARGIISSGEPQIIWSRTEECHGAQVARNRGLALARGDAVLFLDSDDVLADAGLQPFLKALEENSKLDYVFGKVIKTDERLRPLPGNSTVGELFSSAPVDLAGYHWHTMGALYRSSYLKKVGLWNEALTGSQDWEYQARVKLAGGRCEFVDNLVGYWRQHCNSRVGTNTFRADYVKSVIATCLSIASHARANCKYDRALAHKLAGRMFRHALEFSVNDYPAEARYVFREVKRLPGISPYVSIVVSAFSLSSKLLNRCVLGTIRNFH